MTFDPLRTGRSNKDRRDQAFARSVIAEATRRHQQREPSCVLNHDARRRELRDKEMPPTPCSACGWLLSPAKDDIAASNQRQSDYWQRVGGHPDAGYQDHDDERCIWCSEEPQTEEHKPYCSNYCAVQAELS